MRQSWAPLLFAMLLAGCQTFPEPSADPFAGRKTILPPTLHSAPQAAPADPYYSPSNAPAPQYPSGSPPFSAAPTDASPVGPRSVNTGSPQIFRTPGPSPTSTTAPRTSPVGVTRPVFGNPPPNTGSTAPPNTGSTAPAGGVSERRPINMPVRKISIPQEEPAIRPMVNRSADVTILDDSRNTREFTEPSDFDESDELMPEDVTERPDFETAGPRPSFWAGIADDSDAEDNREPEEFRAEDFSGRTKAIATSSKSQRVAARLIPGPGEQALRVHTLDRPTQGSETSQAAVGTTPGDSRGIVVGRRAIRTVPAAATRVAKPLAPEMAALPTSRDETTNQTPEKPPANPGSSRPVVTLSKSPRNQSRSMIVQTSATEDAEDDGPDQATPYGFDPLYQWVRGKLEYSEIDRRWKLRYIPIDGHTDRFGGSVQLGDSPHLKGLTAGQIVTLRGRPNPIDRTRSGFAPEYEVLEVVR